MTDLGTLGGVYSSAVAINEAGQIVGGASDTRAIHAVLWTPDSIIKLSAPSEHGGFAYSINSAGKVAGVIATSVDSNYHPVIWVPSGGPTP
jgi:probable HAF family extracellular repeat protein